MSQGTNRAVTVLACIFTYSSYPDKASLISAIQSLPYHGLATNTYAGLHTMRTRVFNSPGDRPDFRNLAVVITDGQPRINMNLLQAELTAVAQANIDVIAVGLTNQADDPNIKMLASDPKQVYTRIH